MEVQQAAIVAAANLIREADALLILAGAGMGVDSGLPDFRGSQGFWRAYPPLARLGLRFEEVANPRWFHADPELAWGFYGHRLNLYRQTEPHEGFRILRRWAAGKPGGAFVFTSNVDGHFQRAGFPDHSVTECHGSIHHLQCCGACSSEIWSADSTVVTVDESTMRAGESLPSCPQCLGSARPNVLMFSDAWWVEHRTSSQLERYYRWLEQAAKGRPVIIELGAGTTLPRVRSESEWVAGQTHASILRINPRESEVPPGPHVGMACGALAALRAIDALGVA
jgi:NAD-dependent SIR2 family protein deacetylase